MLSEFSAIKCYLMLLLIARELIHLQIGLFLLHRWNGFDLNENEID